MAILGEGLDSDLATLEGLALNPIGLLEGSGPLGLIYRFRLDDGNCLGLAAITAAAMSAAVHEQPLSDTLRAVLSGLSNADYVFAEFLNDVVTLVSTGGAYLGWSAS